MVVFIYELYGCGFKETSTKVIPVKIPKYLRTALLMEHLGGCFCHFDKVTTPWWASANLLFLIKNKICGIVSTKKVCRSGPEYVIYTLAETIPTWFYWLTCRKQKLVQSKALQQRLFLLILGFWQFRQVFVHNLMSILMICVLFVYTGNIDGAVQQQHLNQYINTHLNPIKFHTPLISMLFIVLPLIFAQLSNSYICAQIIFGH